MGRGKPRKGGPPVGMPGTGKSTFIQALVKVLETRGKKALTIRVKDCSGHYVKIQVPEKEVVNHISSILQFTVSDGFRVSFDVLSLAECTNIDCLIAFAEKRYRDDIAQWVIARLKFLKRFVDNDNITLPTCLKGMDELTRRIVIGILYVIRPYFTMPVVLDDLLSFVVNEIYRESFIAMMRPFIVSVNRYLDSRDLLQFNPIVITPGGTAGFYRPAHPNKYVVIFDDKRWEISRREIEKIAYS